MAFSGWHPHLESALVLNLPKMQAQGVIGPQSERWGIYACGTTMGMKSTGSITARSFTTRGGLCTSRTPGEPTRSI